MANKSIPNLQAFSGAMAGTEELELAANDISYRITSSNLFKVVGNLTSQTPAPLSGYRIPLFKISDGLTYSCTLDQIHVAAGTVPAGGSAGQLLAKVSGTDYDTAWTSTVPTVSIANGGTGQVTATAGFDALAPTTTRGDLIARGASSNGRLAIGATARLLRSDGTDPSWAQAVLTSDVTGTLPAANGGTGVANTGKSITLGGSLTTSGAFDTTFTMTAATAVTFPTSGLLATTASAANAALSNLASVAINTTLLPGSNDGAALGSGALAFSDAFLASGGVVNWNNGDVTITHSANLLAFAGASTGYTFDAGITFPVYTNAISWTNSGFQTAVCAFGGPAAGIDVFLGVAGGSRSTTTGGENVGIGFTTLGALTTGVANVAVGGGALTDTTSGSRNIAIGRHALRFNITGSDNVAVGEFAMDGPPGVGCGSYNTAVGASALNINTTGANYNVAIGYKALRLMTTGTLNVGVGSSAIEFATTSTGNTAVGNSAGAALTGSFHTCIGESALTSATSGSKNTAFGWRAGYDISTGSTNIAVGSFETTSAHITTGSNNIFIGNDVRSGISQTGSAQLNIGNLIFGQSVGTGSTLSTGTIGVGIAAAATAVVTIAASTTAKAQINLPTGSAPTAPNDGDIWREDNTNTGLKVRINGVTKTITVS